MKLYPEMFFSVWHLAALILTLIAFIALIIGGYDRRTILKSTGSSLLIFYCIVTIPVGLITQENLHKEEKMLVALDQKYEKAKSAGSEEKVIVHVGAFADEDDDNALLVYAGNYHEAQSFTGSISVTVYDQNDEEVFTETYKDISLQPGEKRKIDSTFTSRPMDTYTYIFEAQPR